jgi:hypothetical protein
MILKTGLVMNFKALRTPVFSQVAHRNQSGCYCICVVVKDG